MCDKQAFRPAPQARSEKQLREKGKEIEERRKGEMTFIEETMR